jgi:hypothetical protein
VFLVRRVATERLQRMLDELSDIAPDLDYAVRRDLAARAR